MASRQRRAGASSRPPLSAAPAPWTGGAPKCDHKGMPVKILVADDHPLSRFALTHLLTRLAPEVKIVEAEDYPSLGRLLDQHPDADLAVVDLNMPGRDQCNLPQLIARARRVPVVILSGSEDPQDVREALDAGAAGFIPKREHPESLLKALRLALSGGLYVPELI